MPDENVLDPAEMTDESIIAELAANANAALSSGVAFSNVGPDGRATAAYLRQGALSKELDRRADVARREEEARYA
jgi:hypothetical protein